MVRYRWLVPVCAVLSISPALIADGKPLSDPKEVLRRSKEAMQKCELISYEAAIEATDWAKRFVPDVKGQVIVGQPAEYDVPRFACQVSIKRAESDETLAYTAGCDGNAYFLVDPKTKKVHQDIDPLVLGANSRDIQRVVLREFHDKDAFKDELETQGAELKGTLEVNGEPCYEVVSPCKTFGQKQVTWAISTKDLLPRRITRVYPNREADGPDATTVITISKVVVNPKLDNDPFVAAVPDGYTKTDEFPE